MSDTKNFNIDKAQELCLVYHKKRHYAKASLIAELISYQVFFGNTSILNCNLGMTKYYKKKTVETVLNDLGYKLVSYNTYVQKDLYGNTYDKVTEFSFTEK